MFSSTMTGEQCDLSDFDRGIVVGAKWAGLKKFLTAQHLESLLKKVTRFYKARRGKHSLSSICPCGNALLMRKVRGEWPCWFELTER